jgi:DUF1680 family protein
MPNEINATRRELLKWGALAACGSHLSASRASPGLPASATAPLTQLGYRQLRLDAGPLQRQAGENHRLLLALDENALLRPFRLRAGLVAPGHDLGGWYDAHAFAPGATFGQWMSALARYYAITGDAPTRAKVQRLVRAYAATVDPDGRFYRDNRFPAYTYDKLVGGLIEARTLAHDAVALATLERTTQAAVRYLPSRAVARNGAFAAIRREWRSGDRLELELPLPLRLQPVDAAHPDTVALLAGPLVLMRVLDGDGPMATTLTRTALLSAQRPSGAAHEWHVRIAGQALKLRPFVDINEERYSAYQDVLAA